MTVTNRTVDMMRRVAMTFHYALLISKCELFVLDQIQFNKIFLNNYTQSEMYDSGNKKKNMNHYERPGHDTVITVAAVPVTTDTTGVAAIHTTRKSDLDALVPLSATAASTESITPLQHRRDKNNTTISYFNIERPTNLRMVFMGDSTSRFQYISMVHFLQTGQWINDETRLVQDSDEVPLRCNSCYK